jgi:hypothetical protein
MSLASRNDSRIVARQFVPQSRALHTYGPLSSRPLKMSSNYGDKQEMFASLTPEQKREFAERRLDRKRTLALGYTLAGVASSPEQEAYDEIMDRVQSPGMGAPDSQAAPVRVLGYTG